MKKVLLITETLEPPYDEGIKKTVYNLYRDLKSNYNLKVIARFSFASGDIVTINTNVLFFSKKIKREINEFKPEVLIYFPFASATFASYLRFKILSHYAKGAKQIFLSLQPKTLKNWQKQIVKLIPPRLALTSSPQLKDFWDHINVNNILLPLQTDLNIFKPLEKESSKIELRNKYDLPANAFIISHMGHLNEGRNLKSLITLQKAGCQIVVVGSSSTPKDSVGPASLKEDLLNEGIIILDGYIEQIEEIYQLSDLYIFPVIAKTGSIGMPLSIMEARACGIPVLTTDFGSIRKFMDSDYGNIHYSKPEHFKEAITKIKEKKNRERKKTKVHEINQQYSQIIKEVINTN